MRDDQDHADAAPNEEAYRELVVSARVYYKNDKRIDWAEWQHLTNEARELGLADEDALRAAREASKNESWSPPLAPPSGSSSLAGINGAARSGSGADSLDAVSLDPASDGDVNVSRLRAGLVINSTYQLEEEIGSGGMGVVWRASHTKLGTTAAIKFLKRAMDEESTARFLREARMAAKLQSPYLARVFDCAQLQTGELFIVMEYFRGEGLDALLRREGPLPVEKAVDYILEACAGLATAHKQDIVHRDIKPANLLLAEHEDGPLEVKIVDFGLSRVAQKEEGEGLTQDQILLGTPEYAPPEQFGNAMNARVPADVWSLGATLYCLLTGLPPFPKDPKLSGLYQMSDLLKRVTGEDPKPPSAAREQVPEGLDKVILKCLEKRPDDRYPSVADLALDLASFGSERAQDLADEVVAVVYGKGEAPADANRVTVLSSADDEPESAGPARDQPAEVSDKTASQRLVMIGIAAVLAFGLLLYLVGR